MQNAGGYCASCAPHTKTVRADQKTKSTRHRGTNARPSHSAILLHARELAGLWRRAFHLEAAGMRSCQKGPAARHFLGAENRTLDRIATVETAIMRRPASDLAETAAQLMLALAALEYVNDADPGVNATYLQRAKRGVHAALMITANRSGVDLASIGGDIYIGQNPWRDPAALSAKEV